MGAVYLAEHEASGRKVALKVLLKIDERRVKRFEREVEAMQRLAHPGIVELVEAGQVGDSPYLAMEYVEGGDLEQALSNGISLRKAVEIVSQSARAVAHAHEHGILHRDLKPANILVDNAGNARVTDFGLAKILDHETRLTRTNATVGTPYYMAPEQIRGGEYTGAVDAYALGVILYSAATGQFPFDAENKVSLFRAILGAAPTPPWQLTELPPGVGELILWAMEKAPADRPTCLQLADALDDHLAGRTVRALAPSRSRRNIKLALGAFASVGLLLGFTTIIVAVKRRNRIAAKRVAADAWSQDLRKAVGKARRARSGRKLPQLLRELTAHREMSRLLAETPESAQAEAAKASEKARARQQALFKILIPKLIANGRTQEALELADERIAIEGKASAPRAAKLRALAADPERAPEAMRMAQALINEDVRDAETLGDLAHGLLALHRPELAANVLALAPDGLRSLRAEALEAAGLYTEALADVDAALLSSPKNAALAVTRIRLSLRLGGDPRDAIRALNELDGGALGVWHVAKGLALEALGQTATARAAYREGTRLDPSQTGSLSRLYLRLGYRQAAEVLLAKQGDPASRLDLAVSEWLGGGGENAALSALERLAKDSKAARASVAVGAAAERWTARIQLARGDQQRAQAAGERAWAIQPDPRSAATLAWALLQAGTLEEAQAALNAAQPATEDGLRLAARLALRAGDTRAARVQINSLPTDLPARAGLELAAARQEDAAPRRMAALGSLAYTAYTRSRTPGQPPPVPVASDETGHALATLVDRITYEARLLRAHATRKIEALKLRSDVLLSRAQALDPHHLAVALDLAQTQMRPEAFDQLVAANPHLPVARKYRLLLLGARRRQTPQAQADLAALANAPRLEPSERAMIAAMLLRSGQDEQAQQVLNPALALESRDRGCYELGVILATRRGDEARAAELKAALTEIRATYRDATRIYKDAYFGNDQSGLPRALKALRQIKRDLPLTYRYWDFRAQAWFGQGGLGRALMCGGEFVIRNANLWPDGLSLWIHFYGWTPEIRAEGILDLAAKRVAQAPDDGAPWLGQALFLLARYNLSEARDPEDLDRAAAAALHAVSLAPQSSGALALAADTLVSAGEAAEAAPLVAAALTLAPNNQYAKFQQARIAASQGDVKLTINILRTLGHLDRPGLQKLLKVDPILSNVNGKPEYQEFLRSIGG